MGRGFYMGICICEQLYPVVGKFGLAGTDMSWGKECLAQSIWRTASDPGLILAVDLRGRGLLSLQHSILTGQGSQFF